MTDKSPRAIAFLAATLPALAIAAKPGPPDSPIDTVVVTASRLDSSQTEASQSLDVLTQDDIEARNAATVTDLLRQVAGLNVIQQGARGNVTSVLMRGGEPNFTVVLIDGLKINDSTNTRGGSYDFSYLDPASIERIEIVRGPMSAVHGSDSLAGVINILTHTGRDGSSVSAEVGGQGLQSASAGVGAATDSMSARFRVHGAREDGDIEGSSYDDAGADASFRARLGDSTNVGFSARYLDANSTGFPEDSGGPLFAALRDVDVRDVTEAHARTFLDHAFDDRWSATVSAGRYEREEAFSSPGIASGVFDGVPPNSANTDFTRTELMASVAFTASESASFAFGSQWQREDGLSAGTLDIGFPLPTDFALDRDTTSLFAETRLRRESLLVQASVRWDDPDRIDAETSAQLGLVLSLPDDRTQLRANWGQGFKAPSFFALAHPLVGNPALLSETADSIDIGVRHGLASGKSNIELSIFRTTFQNLIDFDPALFTNVNRSEVVSQGAELSATLELLPNLRLSGHLTYLDADIRDSDARLRGRPEWRLGAVADWTINDSWRLVTSVIALDDFWEVSIPTGGLFLDGYERIDLSLTFRASDKLRLGLAVDNALDASYREAVGFPGAGVRGRVSARYSF